MPDNFRTLENEPPAKAEVRKEKGTPRLFINGKEVYPLLAWSWEPVHSAPIFKEAGINLLHPVLGLNAAWPESGEYDWSGYDSLFANLLKQNPAAFFLPGILLDVPQWWLDKYPQDLVRCAIQPTRRTIHCFVPGGKMKRAVGCSILVRCCGTEKVATMINQSSGR